MSLESRKDLSPRIGRRQHAAEKTPQHEMIAALQNAQKTQADLFTHKVVKLTKKTKKTNSNAKPILMPDNAKKPVQKKGKSNQKDVRQAKANSSGAKTGLSCPGSAFSSKKGSTAAINVNVVKATGSNVHSVESSNRQSRLGQSVGQSPMPREQSFGSYSG